MIKGIYWIVIMIVCMSAGQPDARVRTKADRWFEDAAYYVAYEEYFKEFTKGVKREVPGYAECRIGECFLRMNRCQGALEWLEKAEGAGCQEKELYEALGEVHLIFGNYAKSKSYFLKYKQLEPMDGKVEAKIASCDWGESAPKENEAVTITRLPRVNGEGSESGISFVSGGLLYSSTGDLLLNRRHKLSERTGLPGSKFYLSEWKDGEYQPGVLLRGVSEDKGTFSFDKKENQLYYIRCMAGDRNCKVIRARLKNNVFKKEKKYRVGNGDYAMLHPFVTNSGQRIYFVSDKSGGVGGADIWYVDRTEKGKWGEPVNAGIFVNTPGNEGFPYVWEDVLYFASDGHVGYGGFDLYRTTLGSEIVQNMGAELNTSYDDFNLVMDADGESGLFVSNRNQESGDDVFYFKMSEPEVLETPETDSHEEIMVDIENNDALPQVAGIQDYEYRIPRDWWVQVAMLRKSFIIDRSLALRVTQLTGKTVNVFEDKTGGRYFYIGEYVEETEARRMVAILKEAGIDCFIKNAMK